MNRSFHPFFNKQREQREEIVRQGEIIASLKTDLSSLQIQLNTATEALHKRIKAHEELLAEHEQLIEDSTKLAERITTLLEQCHNFQAKNADLEVEVARLKHKKLPTREKV